jgi:hypothetical protein
MAPSLQRPSAHCSRHERDMRAFSIMNTIAESGTDIRRRRLVADSQEVEQGRGHSECRKADEDNRNHRVPNKGRVTPQSRHYILAINHCLTPEEHSQTANACSC